MENITSGTNANAVMPSQQNTDQAEEFFAALAEIVRQHCLDCEATVDHYTYQLADRTRHVCRFCGLMVERFKNGDVTFTRNSG
jgi:hypothetical protein